MLRLFLHRFIYSGLLIILMFAVGIGSYKLFLRFFDVPSKMNTSEVTKRIPEEKDQNEPSIDTVSKNVIFVLNDTGEMVGLLIEVLDGYHETLNYTTIPIDSSFTMSSQMYQKMISFVPTVPQILKLGRLNHYFNVENWMDYASMLMEDVIGEKVSYYTVVNEEDFSTWFTKVKDETTGEMVYQFAETFQETISNVQTKEELEQYIRNNYDKLISNFTIDHKLMYLDVYCNLHQKDITFSLIEGKRDANQYRIERKIQ